VELICIQGPTPGQVIATLSHKTRIRQIPMQIAQHPAGGWRVALPEGGYGPRCRDVAAAILMEACECFTDDALAA
jgi:hypothetical protein